MGLFSIFKKKQSVEPPALNTGAWQENAFQAAEAFREPLSPLTGLMPQPSLERPQSIMAAESQTIIAKLDVLAARLEQMNLRLEKIEQALRGQQQPSQPPTYQTIRRW